MMNNLTKTAFAILGMLSIAPMSGYEIQHTMKKSTSNFWSESDGQLYPNLTKLNKLGLITAKESITARAKKVYRLTAKGKKELQSWLQVEPEKHVVRNEMMLKLFFGANVSSKINAEHLHQLQYQTKVMLQQLNETKTQLKHEQKSSLHLPYWLITIQYGIHIGQAKLKWCEEALEILKHA